MCAAGGGDDATQGYQRRRRRPSCSLGPTRQRPAAHALARLTGSPSRRTFRGHGPGPIPPWSASCEKTVLTADAFDVIDRRRPSPPGLAVSRASASTRAVNPMSEPSHLAIRRRHRAPSHHQGRLYELAARRPPRPRDHVNQAAAGHWLWPRGAPDPPGSSRTARHARRSPNHLPIFSGEKYSRGRRRPKAFAEGRAPCRAAGRERHPYRPSRDRSRPKAGDPPPPARKARGVTRERGEPSEISYGNRAARPSALSPSRLNPAQIRDLDHRGLAAATGRHWQYARGARPFAQLHSQALPLAHVPPAERRWYGRRLHRPDREPRMPRSAPRPRSGFGRRRRQRLGPGCRWGSPEHNRRRQVDARVCGHRLPSGGGGPGPDDMAPSKRSSRRRDSRREVPALNAIPSPAPLRASARSRRISATARAATRSIQRPARRTPLAGPVRRSAACRHLPARIGRTRSSRVSPTRPARMASPARPPEAGLFAPPGGAVKRCCGPAPRGGAPPAVQRQLQRLRHPELAP